MRKDVVVATEQGILEKGSDGMTILLRVRPHRDAELLVTLSPDRMKASLSYFPPEGDGAPMSADVVRSRLRQAGVQKGVDEKKLLHLLDRVARGEGFAEQPIAEGRPPRLDAPKRIVFHVHVATGKAVSIRKDGRADFRAQDRITRIQKGDLVATVRPRNPLEEDGWDVTGKAITPPPEAQETLRAGRGISEVIQADGSLQFRAEATGELVRDGPVLSASEAHTVDGDVSMGTGNIKFPGLVRISGSVRSGFTVVAEGVLEIGGAVEGALLSADGSITVGQGIKGESKAVLRSKRNIESMFAEQAVLLAIGDVHLHGPCVRCQVKCNGLLKLDSEKGTLVAGRCARAGAWRCRTSARRRREAPSFPSARTSWSGTRSSAKSARSRRWRRRWPTSTPRCSSRRSALPRRPRRPVPFPRSPRRRPCSRAPVHRRCRP